MMMEYDHITRDIGRKTGQDVADVVRRNVALVDSHEAAFMVATHGASTALAYAAVRFSAAKPELDANAVADALWEIMRPMVAKNVGDAMQSAMIRKAKEG